MGRTLLRPFGVAVVMAAMAAPGVGQGSSVYTQGACVSARGHAGALSLAANLDMLRVAHRMP
jgi:hypothetical protein